MFTQWDKALIAVVMGGIYFLKYFGVFDFGGITEGTLAALIAAITPVLVWFFPNLKKA